MSFGINSFTCWHIHTVLYMKVQMQKQTFRKDEDLQSTQKTTEEHTIDRQMRTFPSSDDKPQDKTALTVGALKEDLFRPIPERTTNLGKSDLMQFSSLVHNIVIKHNIFIGVYVKLVKSILVSYL